MEVTWSVWNAGRAEEALTLSRRTIERNPEFEFHYRTIGSYLTSLGRLGEAQRWIDEARKRNPEGPASWQNECIGFLHLADALSAEDCAKQLNEVHPEKLQTVWLWLGLHFYREEWDAAIATLESLLERAPGDRLPTWTWLQADLIASRGDAERARRLMADAFPEYLEDGLELAATDLEAALTFAAILHANGETQPRDVLLLAMEARIATMHRTRGIGYGVMDVYIHLMRGNRERAIASLREAIDMGWRVTPDWSGTWQGCCSWWMLRQEWKLATLHQDPEFIALMNELEADILKQRLWYEENKDKPLL